jgi:hypothetical protein
MLALSSCALKKLQKRPEKRPDSPVVEIKFPFHDQLVLSRFYGDFAANVVHSK